MQTYRIKNEMIVLRKYISVFHLILIIFLLLFLFGLSKF